MAIFSSLRKYVSGTAGHPHKIRQPAASHSWDHKMGKNSATALSYKCMRKDLITELWKPVVHSVLDIWICHFQLDELSSLPYHCNSWPELPRKLQAPCRRIWASQWEDLFLTPGLWCQTILKIKSLTNEYIKQFHESQKTISSIHS